MLIHLSRNGETLGPFTAEQFVQMLVSGQVQHSDNMWVQSDAWEPLENFERCFGPHEEAGPPTPQRMVTPGSPLTAPSATNLRLNGQRPPRVSHDDEDGNVNLLRTMMGL
jgi:hypothetical protein